MAQLQSWQALYKELAERIIAKIPEVKWVDLWNNQIGFIEDEHMFPTPAVFVSFRMRSPEDAGDNIQNVQLQIDMYYYHETFDKIEDIEKVSGKFLKVDIKSKKPKFTALIDEDVIINGIIENSLIDKLKTDKINFGLKDYLLTIKTIFQPQTTVKPEKTEYFLINYELLKD